MNNLLTIRNLGKRYNDFTLEGVDLSVPAGTVVGLIGGNGAGKTTTIKAALGLIKPSEGDVALFGEPFDMTSPNAARLRELVGIVLDTCSFPRETKVRDVGKMGRAAYQAWDEDVFRHLLEVFDLGEKKKVKDLSRGMGMKLTLAFALSHKPTLLVLDEPTAGLDPLAREEVLELLRKFMADEGHGILLSSHITSDLEKIADSVVCINDGRIVFDKPKDEVCDFPGIVRCRTSEFESLAAKVRESYDDVRVMSQPYGFDLLVPDRFAFCKKHPEASCDRASLEDYMAFSLKGESL